MAIHLFFDREAANYGLKRHIPLDTDREAIHSLIIGASGSGKTYAMLLMLGKMALQGAQITVIDYKGGEDFSFLQGCERFHGYINAYEGLEQFYGILLARQSGNDLSRDYHVLVIDELASWLNSLEKKQSEEARKMVANILMLGRSFNLHLMVGVQRADADYFAKSRDNFSLVVALGNLSSESKQMFFSSDLREQMKPSGRGEGHLLLGGSDMHHIIVPRIGNLEKLQNVILSAVHKQ